MSNKTPAALRQPAQPRPVGLIEIRMAALTAAASLGHGTATALTQDADKIMVWLSAPYVAPQQ